MTAPQHRLNPVRQFVRDAHQLLDEVHQDYRFTLAVLVALAVETSTVMALAASGELLWSMLVMLFGGLGIAVGVAIKAMGSGKS